MGKNKKGGNKQRPPQPSFFQQQQQKFGDGFMNQLNASDVKKNALKILTDLSVGAINPDIAYEYFNQYDFTYNILQVANDNLRYRQYIYLGLVNYPSYQYDQEMQRVGAELYDQITTYTSVVNHLNNILQNITMYNGVYTRFLLQQMISEIRWRRNTFTNGIKLVINPQDDKYIRNKRRQLPHDKGFSNQDEGGFFNKPH